jgi:hypothetical protein
MKKLLVLVALLGAFAFAALPASADTLPPGLPCTPTASGSGAATCTLNAHPFTLPFFAGACAPTVLATAFVTGNVVFHVTQNTATDFWITATQEGMFIGLPSGFSGHATQWFGIENNASNLVVHFISEAQVTAPNGTVSDVNEAGHFSVSASGQPTSVMFDKCNS